MQCMHKNQYPGWVGGGILFSTRNVGVDLVYLHTQLHGEMSRRDVNIVQGSPAVMVYQF